MERATTVGRRGVGLIGFHHTSRREFLTTAAGVALAVRSGCAGPNAASGDSPLREPAALSKLRRQVQRRRRRIIFNNDGGDMQDPRANTVGGFLATRNRQTLGTQVDSIFYSSTSTLMGTYASRVSEIPSEFGGPYVENIAALAAVGQDCLSATVDFCHRHQLEVFWSHRINDIHDSFLDYLLCRWKREHPEYLLGTRKEAEIARANIGTSDRTVLPIKRFWSALNFEHPPVLDYLCRIQQDVCNRYDIDGVECDYIRTPMFFKTIMEGQAATPSQVDILTSFHRRLRKIHLDEGTLRGRPILTAARVPGSVETCQFVGIDIQTWIRDGLVDVLTLTGGYLPFTEPVDELIRIAHDAGIPAYPTISASGMGDDYPMVEAWRGAAMNLFRAGADGINTFNLFPTKTESRFMDIGEVETLAGRDKIFAIEPTVTYKKGDLLGDSITWPYPLPLMIPDDGTTITTKILIGDDISTAAQNRILRSADVRIRLSRSLALGDLVVHLNDELLASAELEPVRSSVRKSDVSESGNNTNSQAGDSEPQERQAAWLVFKPRPSQFRVGLNRLSFHAAKPASHGNHFGEITHVDVPVLYK